MASYSVHIYFVSDDVSLLRKLRRQIASNFEEGEGLFDDDITGNEKYDYADTPIRGFSDDDMERHWFKIDIDYASEPAAVEDFVAETAEEHDNLSVLVITNDHEDETTDQDVWGDLIDFDAIADGDLTRAINRDATRYEVGGERVVNGDDDEYDDDDDDDDDDEEDEEEEDDEESDAEPLEDEDDDGDDDDDDDDDGAAKPRRRR